MEFGIHKSERNIFIKKYFLLFLKFMFNRKVNPVCYTRGLKVMQKKKRKKKCRLARLGEQPLHQNIKNEEGGRFCIQKLLFPPFKSNTHGIYEFAALGSLFSHCSIPFCAFVHHQQVSIPSLSFLAFHWCIFYLLLVL